MFLATKSSGFLLKETLIYICKNFSDPEASRLDALNLDRNFHEGQTLKA